MQAVAENLATLQAWLPAPCLGEIPYLEKPTPETVAACLDDQLLAHIQ
ncbi:MAG: hypothetical protein KZQ89_11590 [Candidatus Thiodiazotropha sp. (ex Lucinoma kastoroae)]|nr:hypothetical protein [Candidatus Thiodiazotropha sp. (ex Lucinoma kastoroae)]MCU7859492.1 hypothetical protein [Candidatus Thiodiazotropha sp. (ex Lucinoma kastoroae)]